MPARCAPCLTNPIQLLQAGAIADAVAGVVSQIGSGAGVEEDEQGGASGGDPDDGFGVFIEYYDTANFAGHFRSETRPSLSLAWMQERESGREDAAPGQDSRQTWLEPFEWRFSPQTMSARVCAEISPVLPAFDWQGGLASQGDLPVRFLVRASGPVAVFLTEEGSGAAGLGSRLVVEAWGWQRLAATAVMFDGVAAPSLFVEGAQVVLKAGLGLGLGRGGKYTLLVVHESPAPTWQAGATPRYLQVALRLLSTTALGAQGTVVPVPREWLRPVGRGGVLMSLYPTEAHGGLRAARARATVMLPAFVMPALLPLPGGESGSKRGFSARMAAQLAPQLTQQRKLILAARPSCRPGSCRGAAAPDRAPPPPALWVVSG